METQWLAFCVAALMLTLMPGPDTFLVMGNAVAGGARRGLAAAAGTTSGGLFHVALFALGVTQLLMYSERAFWTVKMLGACYLAFLGVKALRAALRPRAHAPAQLAAPAASLWRAFAQGALTNALNPKIAMFYLAFLPQFLAPGPHMARDSMSMIGLHYAIGAVWLGIVAIGSARMAGAMRSARVARALDGVIGAMMLGFGARLALASR